MTAPTLSLARSTHAVLDGQEIGFDGGRYYRIASYDRMSPFLMTVVGGSDLWMFVSSTGGISAGRQDADHAVFPYYTEDKVAEGAGHTGGVTVLRVHHPDGATTWRPFTPAEPGGPAAVRTLYKDLLGTTLVFEETREDLGLCLRVAWRTSARYGVVRTGQLTYVGDRSVDVEVLDGFRNLLPAGATAQVQNELSVLLDAYKRSELDTSTGLGLFSFSSVLTDLAEASESLEATVAWQVGLDPDAHLLSSRQVRAFEEGHAVVTEHDVRGERAAYLTRTRLGLAPGQRQVWHTVADVGLSAADVVALAEELGDPERLAGRLDADVRGTRESLSELLAAADATQLTGDELATAHHRANVLFNIMRGGVPAQGYTVRGADVRAFVRLRSPRTADRCAQVLETLPERMTHPELTALAGRQDDPDLWRLLTEYLPLTFSRRHGDPSRPWNAFRISLREPDGSLRLDHQGNWRDIFQNWEALAWSFPELVESMVTVFLDATTADGYNPYRISRGGIDWEVPEPGNPWANIGYWSDHQIVYLVKLLETSERFHPGRLGRLGHRAVFTHADVPYRIATYAETVRDPHATIAFDAEAAAAVERRIADEGADGRLVHGPDGDLVRATLGEKLLVLLLAKVVNMVPGGGIWMNTQRPEWNDANNALVGRGLSVVTLAYLRRYLDAVRPLLDGDQVLSADVADLLAEVRSILLGHDPATAATDDVVRRRVMDELGAAGTAYRTRVYSGAPGEKVAVPADEIRELIDTLALHVDTGLKENRRPDALYHSYNLLTTEDGRASVARLQVMLEGQVAVLSSGLLGARESLDLLQGLRRSALYRADQHSYLLYPDRSLPTFLEKNGVPAEKAAACPLVEALVAAGDRSVILRDVRGTYRFAPGVRNARELDARLAVVAGTVLPRETVERDRAALLAIYEDVFRHAEFTGRSGTFFAYEGLGSIYWHMVSKLLLAVQEVLERAVREGEEPALVAELESFYEDVRRGLGYCKTPEVYGAFPVDPYSHTPGGRGARQPGMTGQVKEEVLTRRAELGLQVEDGRLVFRPLLLRAEEWTDGATPFRYLDVSGTPREADLPSPGLAFTFCQVPVLYRRGSAPAVQVRYADGSAAAHPGDRLPADVSAEVFRRTGAVESIVVTLPDDDGAVGGSGGR